MTKYLIQHGPAKGTKIEKAIIDNYCDGVIFAPIHFMILNFTTHAMILVYIKI